MTFEPTFAYTSLICRHQHTTQLLLLGLSSNALPAAILALAAGALSFPSGEAGASSSPMPGSQAKAGGGGGGVKGAK